eukprot:2894450-Rhodomonas_salina.2
MACLRIRFAEPGTGVSDITIILCRCYAVSGTGTENATRCPVLRQGIPALGTSHGGRKAENC